MLHELGERVLRDALRGTVEHLDGHLWRADARERRRLVATSPGQVQAPTRRRLPAQRGHRQRVAIAQSIGIVAVLTAPQNRDRLFAAGVEVVASTPQEFAAEIKAESARLEKVFRSAGIKAE